jgi:spore coat protein JB
MNYRDKNRPMGIYEKPFIGPQSTKKMMPEHKQMPTGTLNLFPVDEALLRGTIFRGLYDPYRKKEMPLKPLPTNERERMLHDVNKYYFALHEMRMYLDNFPEDQEAISLFTNFQRSYTKAKREYEKRFDALDIEAENLDTSPWNWTVGRWPWEGDM